MSNDELTVKALDRLLPKCGVRRTTLELVGLLGIVGINVLAIEHRKYVEKLK